METGREPALGEEIRGTQPPAEIAEDCWHHGSYRKPVRIGACNTGQTPGLKTIETYFLMFRRPEVLNQGVSRVSFFQQLQGRQCHTHGPENTCLTFLPFSSLGR